MKKYVIYKATFPNGKVYIGKSGNFKSRIYQHRWNSLSKDKKMLIVSKSILKYEFENISWDIIHNCYSKEDMDLQEIYYITMYNSTNIKFGYNMVCGNKYPIKNIDSNNFNDKYRVEIIKKTLSSKGKDSNKYIEITTKLENIIIYDYKSGLSIGSLSNKHKITRNRLKRLLIKNNIEIILDRPCYNKFTPSDEQIRIITDGFNNGKTIKLMAEEIKLSIQMVSRVLNDLGLRISKRFLNGKRYDGTTRKTKQTNKKQKSIYEET